MKTHLILLAVMMMAAAAQADPRIWDPHGVPILQNGALEWERAVAQQENGNALVAWSDMRSGSRDVYAQMISPDGAMAWDSAGVDVTRHGAEQSNPVAAPTTNGWIVAWIDYRDEPRGGGTYGYGGDVWAQRMDGAGNLLWSSQGVYGVCIDRISSETVPGSLRLISDNAGGAWITWIASISYYPTLLVQHVTFQGTVDWPSPIIISDRTGGDYGVISDGAGGIVLAWSYQTGMDVYAIRATRIQSDGGLPWGESITVASMPPIRNGEPRLCSDGSGGAYVAWNSHIAGSQDYDIWAQRLSANGEAMWQANGVCLCSLPGYRMNLSLASSRSGSVTDGCLLTWEDDREYTGYARYFAQKLNPAGLARWEENGTLFCDSARAYCKLSICSDGAGGLVGVCEDYSATSEDDWGANISATHLDEQGAMAWPMERMPVLIEPRDQSLPVIIPQSDGYLVAAQSEVERGNQLVFQKLNRTSGERLFGEDGVNLVRCYQYGGWGALAVPMSGGRTGLLWSENHSYYLILDSLGGVEGGLRDRELAQGLDTVYGFWNVGSVCADGSGGFFASCTIGNEEYGFLSFLSHVGADGERISDEDGEWVWRDDVNEGQWNVALAADGTGGCYAMFSAYVGGEYGLYARRYDAHCLPLWDEVVMLSDQTLWDSYQLKVIPRSNGSCIVAYSDYVAGLMMARIAAVGAISWKITVADSSLMPWNPRLVPDGQDGAYCVWPDDRRGTDRDLIYAQHVSADGVPLWQENGIPVSDPVPRQLSPRPVVDPDDNLFVVWIDQTDATNEQVMAQKFSPTGVREWSNTGLPVCDAPYGQFTPAAVSDQMGGLFVVWSDYRTLSGSSRHPLLAGNHLNGEGQAGPDPFWQPQLGAILCDSTTELIDSPLLVESSPGTAVILWVTDRWQSSSRILDLLGQRIGAVGLAAEEQASEIPNAFTLLPCYPNPFNSTTAIAFDLPVTSKVRLAVYDVLGREAAMLTDRVLPSGRHDLLFDASALASGVYFCRLQAGDFAQTRKMVLVK
ncbi:MAG: T9SS type A sorting domain-containing protein [bacterium]|nr:T9SS type A sorting domain-containing protein [bacterium]